MKVEFKEAEKGTPLHLITKPGLYRSIGPNPGLWVVFRSSCGELFSTVIGGTGSKAGKVVCGNTFPRASEVASASRGRLIPVAGPVTIYPEGE